MKPQNDIHSYALIISAHIVAKFTEAEKKRIKNIILFGSAARMQAFEDSDIDIFFDVDASETLQDKMKKRINKIIDEWRISQEALEFKMRKIDNDVNIIIGRIDDWKDLQRNMISSGTVLYGKYKSAEYPKEMHVIFSWENLKKNKGAILNKFYGYKAGRKYYPGLLKKMNGRKIGRGTILIPADNKETIIVVLEKYSVDYSMLEVWI